MDHKNLLKKAVVIMVDELDRCLPEYTIKVSERLHHIFTDLKNVIVFVSMDKTNFTDVGAIINSCIAIEKIQSVEEIYGKYSRNDKELDCSYRNE